MNGKRLGTSNRRKSKQFGDERFCNADNCSTRLSIYNKKKFCFLHAPLTYPRVRGHLPRGDK